MSLSASPAEGTLPLPFYPETLEDIQELALLEYFLQLSFHTTDLHITRGWLLCSEEKEKSFKDDSKKYEGSIISSWMDMNRMDPPQSFEDCLNKCVMEVDLRKQLFEMGTIAPPLGFQGNPTGSYKMLLFKVALGRVMLYTPEAGSNDDFLKREIPKMYDSLELNVNPEPKYYNSLYRINSPEQVLLYAAVEFEFRPVRVDIPEPVCEICETAVASWYCPSDKAHFCNECDIKHHSATPIFSRHARTTCSKSPIQFGICENHPSEIVDVVCIKCYFTLCSHCILFGDHSDSSFLDHPLMSTLDAYEYSMKNSSESDESLAQRIDFITERINNRQDLLSQIYANFDHIKKKIENGRDLLIGQLDIMRKKKLRYLDAVKRDVETELSLIDWLESFLNHLLLSLGPSDFVECKKRYDLLVEKMFGGEPRVTADIKDMPIWVAQKLVLVGEVRLRSFPLEMPRLNNICNIDEVKRHVQDGTEIPEDWSPLNLYKDFPDIVVHGSEEKLNMKQKLDTVLTNYPGTTPNCLKDSCYDHHKTEDDYEDGLESIKVQENPIIDDLWRLLSERRMRTLLQLIKVTRVPEKKQLVKQLSILANYFEEVDNLFKSAAQFELKAISQECGYCILMRSSSCLSDILSFIFLSEDNGCLESEKWINGMCSGMSHFLQQDNDKEYQKEAREFTTKVINRVTESLDVIAIPSSLRFVLYFLADLVPQHSASLCVDMLIGVLFSTFICKSITQKSFDTGKTFQKSFLTEVSFLMGRIGILCWELTMPHDKKDSLELSLASKLKNWMQNILKKPRLTSKIHTRPSKAIPDARDATTFICRVIATLEKNLDAGKLDIPIQEVNSLSSDYNFLPLFEIARTSCTN